MRRRTTDGLPFDPDLGDDSSDAPGLGDASDARLSAAAGTGGPQWAILAAISAGGALGGTSRYGVDQLLPVTLHAFPWGTFAVNIVGAFLLGLLLVLILERWPRRRYLRPFLAIGFLGSFTTFSTWMLEIAQLADGGDLGVAAAYLGASLLVGLLVTGLGVGFGRRLLHSKLTSGSALAP